MSCQKYSVAPNSALSVFMSQLQEQDLKANAPVGVKGRRAHATYVVDFLIMNLYS